MLKLTNVTFLVIYCSFIYWLSSRPSLPTPMLFMHQDKIHHMGAYFIMGIFAWRFFNIFFSKPLLVSIVSLFFCSLYGLSDEWHQSFVPGRDADVMDWVADTLGALIALCILYFRKKT
ncbi:MAG: VanZ family protein [Methylococcales bacterium]|nr:VanZ family protein [Methylococcales bacterium]